MATPNSNHSTFEAGVFDDIDSARQAVRGLLASGFSKDHITVVCSDKTKEQYFSEFDHEQPAGTHTPTAAVVGGTIGATLGGLAVVASAAVTGGITILAAGPITAWAGGVAGGLVGAMMTRGVEGELANFYQQAVLDGQILVAAEGDLPENQPALAKAADVLRDAGAKPLPLSEG